VAAADGDFPYEIDSSTQLNGNNESINLSDVVLTDAIEPSSSIFTNLFGFFKLSGKEYDT